jgi:hypothetical protein
LYTALDQLRAAGLVGVDREEITASRLRRYYRVIPGQTPAIPHPQPGTDLRVGDAAREATAAALREHFAQGRLSLCELVARLDVALTATTHGEITQITRDLPRL